MAQIAAAAGAKPSRAGPLCENGGGGGWGNQVGPLKKMAAAVAKGTKCDLLNKWRWCVPWFLHGTTYNTCKCAAKMVARRQNKCGLQQKLAQQALPAQPAHRNQISSAEPSATN